eukprot:TRINITY_DN7109_c0_g1_i2.p1 TRINITY_DN7109_c0_g1~~TRINITY_DN7109_c0_g1_i2.p1  ORF type:complete len:111 (-),score=4.72 TRINITY_DN7109_c0_g1_i2:39-371(-)
MSSYHTDCWISSQYNNQASSSSSADDVGILLMPQASYVSSSSVSTSSPFVMVDAHFQAAGYGMVSSPITTRAPVWAYSVQILDAPGPPPTPAIVLLHESDRTHQSHMWRY